MSYAIEFFNYLAPKAVKKGCRHCHETGIEGYRNGKAIVCRCIDRNINAAKKSRCQKLMMTNPFFAEAHNG